MGSSCRQSPPRSRALESGDSSAASHGPRNRVANSTSQGFFTITRPMLQCPPPYQGGLLVLQGATSRVARAGVSWSGARESNSSCRFGRPVVHLEQAPHASPPPLRVRGRRAVPAVSSDGADGRDRTGFRRSGTRPGFQNAPAIPASHLPVPGEGGSTFAAHAGIGRIPKFVECVGIEPTRCPGSKPDRPPRARHSKLTVDVLLVHPAINGRGKRNCTSVYDLVRPEGVEPSHLRVKAVYPPQGDGRIGCFLRGGTPRPV